MSHTARGQQSPAFAACSATRELGSTFIVKDLFPPRRSRASASRDLSAVFAAGAWDADDGFLDWLTGDSWLSSHPARTWMWRTSLVSEAIEKRALSSKSIWPFNRSRLLQSWLTSASLHSVTAIYEMSCTPNLSLLSPNIKSNVAWGF